MQGTINGYGERVGVASGAGSCPTQTQAGAGYQVIQSTITDNTRWAIEHGVAAIPLSAFYAEGFDQRVVRFCFAKRDETLARAAERLRTG